MAKSNAVWGIDIGQCALKALKCTQEGDDLVAEAFDYIEYPKILSQPEAEPDKLINEALQEFLSRNDVKDAKVAMSVPGQSGLAKFFKPPPVDAKKIPDIVKYEARQQIPFDLDDVIWDYQQMGGGAEVDGFALETEIGLFAMKRDQVLRQLRPFERVEMELDIVQLAPLSIYNFVAYDLLADGPTAEEFDPENPPESLVVLSMGTETTDLVVTNGFRLWQRSIPLGGNHFTKQLTKEMKLTFAKAEHLKRNARQAEDPKAVFQAMRSVFNDLVTEIQRSIGYFQGIDRKAKIGGVVLLGNAVKLPGLQQYLAKNLGYEVVKFDSFSKLTGSSVVSSPAFKDNLYAYGVCYGLCLQGLGESSLSTNLVPREMIIQRMIREKKPWALATCAALLLAMSVHFVAQNRVWQNVREDKVTANSTWKAAEARAAQAQTTFNGHDQKHKEKEAELTRLDVLGKEVAGNADRRLLWPEVLTALNTALPKTQGIQPGTYVSPKKIPLYKRDEIYVDYVESKAFGDLAKWFDDEHKVHYNEAQKTLNWIQNGAPPAKEEGDGASGDGNSGGDATAQAVEGPKGPGWVIELSGYHYRNDAKDSSQLHLIERNHVYRTLINNLENGSVTLATPDGPTTFTMKELGIKYPMIIKHSRVDSSHKIRNPDAEPQTKGGGFGGGMDGGTDGMMGGFGGGGFGGSPQQPDKPKEEEGEKEPPFFRAPLYKFTMQFVWQETLLTDRLIEQEKRREELEKQQQQQQESVALSEQGN